MALEDLHLIWDVLISSQRAKQLLSTDWPNIMLLNIVKLSTLLIKKASHKRYVTLTTLAVVWALWSFKTFIWSELYWWALKQQKICCLQIDHIIDQIRWLPKPAGWDFISPCWSFKKKKKKRLSYLQCYCYCYISYLAKKISQWALSAFTTRKFPRQTCIGSTSVVCL